MTIESSLERKTQEPLPHTYAEGVTAGSPGLQCEASYPGFKVVQNKYATPKGLLPTGNELQQRFQRRRSGDLNPG